MSAINIIDNYTPGPSTAQLVAQAIAKNPEISGRVEAAAKLVAHVATLPTQVVPNHDRYWLVTGRRAPCGYYLVDTVAQSCSCLGHRAYRNGSAMGWNWCKHRLAVALVILRNGDYDYTTPDDIPDDIERAAVALITRSTAAAFHIVPPDPTRRR